MRWMGIEGSRPAADVEALVRDDGAAAAVPGAVVAVRGRAGRSPQAGRRPAGTPRWVTGHPARTRTHPGGGRWNRWRHGDYWRSYSRSPKNPAFQLLQNSSKSASAGS